MISLLPKIILAVICALIAYQSALLTWSLYPTEAQSYRWEPTAKVSSNTAKLSTISLQNQTLFGQYQGDKKVQKPTEAPKTRLKLTLVGIIASSEPRLSSVIIEYRNKQDSYFIDSEITGTDAVVSEIYSDRIIITVNGEEQTLVLDGLEQDNKRLARVESNQAVQSKSTSRSQRIELDRGELIKNPGKLLDYIKISPVREGNVVKGYRVNPGKEPSIFEEAGLQAGDLAIELNGVDLTDTVEAVQLMKEFPTMTDISLTVDRNGEINELFFSIP